MALVLLLTGADEMVSELGIVHSTKHSLINISQRLCNTTHADVIKIMLLKCQSFLLRRHLHKPCIIIINRIPRLWNSLPSINLDLSSQSIRAKIKSLLWEHFLNNFVSDCPCTFHFKCPCSRCTYT